MFRPGHERRVGRRATPGAAPAGRPRGAIAISPASSASRELAYLRSWRSGGQRGGEALRRLTASTSCSGGSAPSGRRRRRAAARAAYRCRPTRAPAARRADQHHQVGAGVEPRGSARGAPVMAGATTRCSAHGSAPPGRRRRRAARQHARRAGTGRRDHQLLDARISTTRSTPASSRPPHARRAGAGRRDHQLLDARISTTRPAPASSRAAARAARR